MYLKIFFEVENKFYFNILKKLHQLGYNMQVVPIYKEYYYDDFIEFYSREKDGPFVEMFLCSPRMIRKNAFSKGSLLILPWEYEFKKSDMSIFKSIDHIFSFRSDIINKIKEIGIDKNKITKCFYLPYVDYFNAPDSKKFKFVLHSDWIKELCWKDVVFCYCNHFKNKEADLIISTNEKIDIINKDLQDFMSLNNFNKFDNIYTLSNHSFNDCVKFADCFIFVYKNNYYDENVLKTMKFNVPLIVSRLAVYQDFCRKNNCWVVDFLKNDNLNTEDLSKNMLAVYSNKKLAKAKSDEAKSYLEYLEKDSNFIDLLINKFYSLDILPLCDLNIEIKKNGNLI